MKNRFRIALLGAALLVVAVFLVMRHPRGHDVQPAVAVSDPSLTNPILSRREPLVSASVSSSPRQLSALTNTIATATGEAAKSIRLLLDSNASLAERRRAAWALARDGSPEAMAALKLACGSGPSELKAAIGESLGECGHGDARPMMLDLLAGDDLVAARGAIRGLAARGGMDSVTVLRDLLFDSARAESLRTEAALGLGNIAEPAAGEALIRAASSLQDEAIAEQVLEGIGRRAITETETFYRTYLASPAYSSELKAAAIEGLAHAEGDPTPLLLELASNSESTLRSAAAWALVGATSDTDLSGPVVQWLQQEPDSGVRRRLYQVLSAHSVGTPDAVLTRVEHETDPQTRVAGLTFLAGVSASGTSEAIADYFRLKALPELKSLALAEKDPSLRLQAVMSLRRAMSPEAEAVLSEIAAASADKKVVAAATAALRR